MTFPNQIIPFHLTANGFNPPQQCWFYPVNTRPVIDGSESVSEMTILMNVLKFYASLPVVMLSSSLVGYLSPVPTLRFWSRALTCYCSLLLCASYGVIASILLRIAGRPTLAQWATARSFLGITGPLIGWEWDVQGEEILSKTRPVVFISNHQR